MITKNRNNYDHVKHSDCPRNRYSGTSNRVIYCYDYVGLLATSAHGVLLCQAAPHRSGGNLGLPVVIQFDDPVAIMRPKEEVVFLRLLPEGFEPSDQDVVSSLLRARTELTLDCEDL